MYLPIIQYVNIQYVKYIKYVKLKRKNCSKYILKIAYIVGGKDSIFWCMRDTEFCDLLSPKRILILLNSHISKTTINFS